MKDLEHNIKQYTREISEYRHDQWTYLWDPWGSHLDRLIRLRKEKIDILNDLKKRIKEAGLYQATCELNARTRRQITIYMWGFATVIVDLGGGTAIGGTSQAVCKSVPGTTGRTTTRPKTQEKPTPKDFEKGGKKHDPRFTPEEAAKRRGVRPGSKAFGAEQFRERFKDPADAIGDALGEAKLADKEATGNPSIIEQGFTETHYYLDSNGKQWTVFHNPTTGEYAGAHPSSSN
jgi:hypothetical protein